MALDIDQDHLTLDGREYLVHAQPAARALPRHLRASFQKFEESRVPLSIIRWSNPTFCQQDLDLVCAEFTQIDDVFCSSFCSREYASDSACSLIESDQMFSSHCPHC